MAWTVVLAGYFAVTFAQFEMIRPEYAYAQDVTSRSWLLGAVTTAVIVGAVLTVPFALRPGLWLALAAVVPAIGSADPSYTSFVVWFGGAFLALIALDTVGEHRQRRVVCLYDPSRTPVTTGPLTYLTRWQRRAALAPSRAVAVIGGITCALGLFAASWYAADAAVTAAFRAAAQVHVAVVAANDGWDAYVRIHGHTVRVPDWEGLHPAGDVTAVRYDLRTGRAEFVDEAYDISKTLMYATLSLSLTAATWLPYLIRRRRLARLLDHGGPMLALRVTASPDHRDIRLAAMDADPVTSANDGRGSFARVPRELPVTVDADNPLNTRLRALLWVQNEAPTEAGRSGPIFQDIPPAPPQQEATPARPAVVVGLGAEDDPLIILLTPTRWAIGTAGVRATPTT